MNGSTITNFIKQCLFSAAILSMLLVQSLHAKPGDLDTTFGQNGTVIVPVSGTSSTESGNAVAVQPDGKVLIVGSADHDVAILRLNADGTKDTTFGAGGKVVANFSGGQDAGYAVAVLPNGKFIVAGQTYLNSGAGAFFVARYLTNGVLDTTFGINGLTQISFGDPANSDSQANALAIQPDGKIIVVGYTFVFSNPQYFGIARLNADGSFDSTFGTGGKVTTYPGSGYAASANAVTLQSDGKILVAGNSTSPSTNSQFTVARYLTNGLLDTAFGTNGLTSFQYGDRSCVAFGIALQSNGKIIMGGDIDDNGLDQTKTNVIEGGFMVARLNTDGSLDTSFGFANGIDAGYAAGSVQNNGRALLVFSDDSIELFGSTQLSGQGLNYAIVPYTANGITTNLYLASANFSANYTEQCLAVAITHNGYGLVLAGQSDQIDGAITTNGVQISGGITTNAVGVTVTNITDGGNIGILFALTNEQNLIESIGKFPISVVQSYANVVTVQPDGKIVAVGNSGSSLPYSASVVRLNADGTQDATFGNDGVTSISPNEEAFCAGLAIQSDGKIVAAGTSVNQTNNVQQPLLLRFTSAGVLDTNFATGGIGLYNLSSGATYGIFYSMRVQPDGKIVAAGLSGTSTFSLLIARFLTNGAPDTSFGNGGFVTTAIGSYAAANDVQILPSGKIIAAGQVNSGTSEFGVVQVNSDGTLDSTFGTGGVQTYNLGGYSSKAESIAVQSDGKILISGQSSDSSGFSVYAEVIRCLTNGMLDTTFGTGGFIRTNFGITILNGNCVKIQTNGKIVVGGQYEDQTVTPWVNDFAVFRLLSNGTVDSSFGTNGLEHNAPTSNFEDYASVNGIAIQNDGSIVVAGLGASSNGVDNFAFARYIGDLPPPIITVPSNIIAEATSASGAVVNFTTSATDSSGAVTTTNTPASGSTFPLGITTVTVTATDTNGIATNTFTVTVQDATPPVITLLGANPLTNNIHTAFTDPGATATDTVAGNLTGAIIVTGTVNANHAGTYMLTYTVSDNYGNTAVTNRTVVIVIPPPSLSIALTSLTTNFNASFGLASTVIVESTNLGNGPFQVVAADVNNDGKVDLITANLTNETITVFTNNGSGGFALSATLPTTVAVRYVVAVDVKGDGNVALIYTGLSSLTMLTNNGSGGFGSNTTYIDASSLWMVTSADINGDGKPDLITANTTATAGLLTVLTNNGTGGFGDYDLTIQTTGYNHAESVAVADVNHDGKMDLIGDYHGGALTILTNSGVGAVSPFKSEGVAGVNGNYSVVAADVNNDGNVDLICVNSQTNTLTVFTNNGTGVFGTNAIYTVGKNPVSVVAADVNNDGWVDLICANTNDNTLTVLTNNRSGGFVLAATLNTGKVPDSVVAADVNGDGGMDLISANFGDDTLTVWTNTPAVVTNTVKHFVISWPWPSTGYVLQQNTNLATANWTTFSGLMSSNNTSMSVTIMPGTGNMFFRLAHP